MLFEYQVRTVADESIDVEDIGNVCLEAYNDVGQEWILMITTNLGWSTIVQAGAIMSDLNQADTYFSFFQQQLEYNEAKLKNAISKFLCDPKREITQVFFTNPNDVIEKLSNLDGVKIVYG